MLLTVFKPRLARFAVAELRTRLWLRVGACCFFLNFNFFFWVLGGGVVGRGWVWVFFFSDHRLFFSATIVFCSQQFLCFVDLAQQHLCFSWMVRCIFVMACLCVFRLMAVRFCSIACFCSQRFCLPLSFNPW